MPDDDILGLVPVVVEGHDSDSPVAPVNASDGIVLEIADVRILVPAEFAPDHLGQVLSAIRAST